MRKTRTSTLPELLSVSVAAENILLVEVGEGWVEGGVQIPYVPEEGEQLETVPGPAGLVYIVKNGKRIGVKVPDQRFGDQRFPLEKLMGEKLDISKAETPEGWRLNGITPKSVYRKSKPDGYADPSGEETMSHKLYLVFDKKIPEGELHLDTPKDLLEQSSTDVVYDPAILRSEVIHVTQLGFRPDDPAKRAWISQWMGLGGPISYEMYKRFEVRDSGDEVVYSGEIRRHGGTPFSAEADPALPISTGAPVYELDFTEINVPGTYRIVVPGLGCSDPFTIDETETWERGFRASMNGLFCQRSGIETGEPYTSFRRPRCYHPDDGKVVHHSECSLFESGNGLNAYGTDYNNFGNLVRKATDEVVENAWGGYFDACDWDRRIQHLNATLLGLELYLMFPERMDNVTLPLPESGDGVPDIISEGLWNIDHYRRMQTPEGGIRGGVEAFEHPILGQCGWQDTWPCYAYKPDFWSAWYYTAAAARAAFALKRSKPELAAVYEESAVRAFDWAEAEYDRLKVTESPKWRPAAHKRALIQRELAAVDLYRLTGREDCDRLYRELRTPHGYDAAFVYATLPDGMGDAALKAECRKTLTEAAERGLAYGEKAPYRLTVTDPSETRTGPYSSFFTVPNCRQLIRAHYLTGDPRYLAGVIDAYQFACGANPDNLIFTTGVGTREPRNVLHHDSRITGQPAPAGITIFGPHTWDERDSFLLWELRKEVLNPGAFIWPVTECFLDIYRYPSQVEYTVQESIGPNAYAWGYLAFRPKLEAKTSL